MPVSAKLAKLPLGDLLDAFASNEPVPGGGSASALSGALGASLLMMVAGMARTKTGAAEETADLAEAAAGLRSLRDELLSLVDRDSAAYAAVVDALALPKAAEDEREARRAAIQEAMVEAAAVPLDTMRACRVALQQAVTVARCGNRHAASDVGVAIWLLMTGIEGGGLNVDVNLASIGDAGVAAELRQERDSIQQAASVDAAAARTALR